MATALLIGTNAWAADVPFSGTTGAELQTAMNNAASGTKLVFQNDVNLNDGPVWLGTANLDDPAKSITLDLNGHTIERNASTNTAYYMFVITRGELIIDNGTVTLTGTTFKGTSFNENSQIFSVFGSYKSSYWTEDGTSVNANPTNTMDEGYFTHLEIGENLNIIGGENVLGSAIVIDKLTKGSGPISGSINTAINYRTDIRNSDSYGFAYGARVDVKGSITMLGKSGNYVKYETVNGVANTPVTYGYKCYGIKTNGNLASPLNTDKGGIKAKANVGFTTTDSYFDATYDVEEHKHDTIDAPFVYVHKNARIVTNNGSTRSTAIYSSGYAKYLIKGTCEGNVGVNIKSGKVILDDATIASTATTYTQATGQGGASGSGSAVVLNSTSYEGGMQVTISGDTKITADAGYAIEEVVNTQTTTVLDNPDYVDEATTPGVSPTVEVKETKVLDIIFNGGTIEGGDKGAVVVSYETEAANQDQDEETTITVYGATVSGETKVGTDGDLTDLLPTDESENPTAHITVVTDPETGKQTLVVSKGPEPTTSNKVSDQAEDASVKWEGPAYVNDEIAANSSLKLKELVINDTITKAEAIADPSLTAGALRQQTLTLRAGSSLTVGRVVLGSKAKIIVEPGAKFIVTGEQGIVAPSVDNIVLQASATDQAVFLFNPAVTSNRHPHATVKVLAKQIGYLNVPNIGIDWYWLRFALPIQEATTWTKVPNVPSYVYGWSYTIDDWEQYTALTQMKPFQGTLVSADNEGLQDVEYTFTGVLAGGNDNNSLQFQRDGYHFFGNSYTGHISVDKLVEQIMGDSEIDGTVWVWGADQNYHAVPLLALRNNPAAFQDYQKEIAPMETFVLKHNVTTTGSTELNYASAVWGNPRYASLTGAAAGAPRRAIANENTHVRVVVTAENGKSDEVMLFEDALCSDDFDNGYDGTKYMNENALNMYATVNGNNYSFVATDNIEGKKLTINTVNEVNYTMSFVNVNGEEYAIRDNATGAVIAIEEEATYQFAAQPNSVVEDRFEVVGIQKITTAIENTEAKASAKGIYTIMGQYVGEDFDLLPAGIYVVNGVKIVK